MFADFCMHKNREWGFMAAVGRPRPPWSIDARNCIEQKTSSPSPILPSAPPPSPCIMLPWWVKSADAKKQPIWRGGCQYNGLEAGRHGWVVCVKLATLPSKNTHHKQIDWPDQWCANYNIVVGTGDQDKHQMLEFCKTICYRAIPYHFYWFRIAMPNPPAYGVRIHTWSTNLYPPAP